MWLRWRDDREPERWWMNVVDVDGCGSNVKRQGNLVSRYCRWRVNTLWDFELPSA